METKTYFASSIRAAMEVARRELGPDAMLVASEPAAEGTRSLGRLEVTFAWEPGDVVTPGRVPETMAKLPVTPIAAGRRADSGLEDIRREISALRMAFGKQAGGPVAGEASAVRFVEPDDEAVDRLAETGMGRDMARQIVGAAAKSGGRIGEGIVREITRRIPVSEFVLPAGDECRTLAFVGPAGRGKTSSLIKVALRYGLGQRIPTRIYSAGAQGVGSSEQMARYAAILGVPFQAVESFDSLGLALHGERWKGLILIDTPALVVGERQETEAMTRFFVRRPEIEKHLVLGAEAHSADMQNMMARYAAIQPSKLLFTGVDETQGLGAAVDAMIRSGVAATFLATGPAIPEDLEEVNAEKLARSLWTVNGLAARAA